MPFLEVFPLVRLHRLDAGPPHGQESVEVFLLLGRALGLVEKHQGLEVFLFLAAQTEQLCEFEHELEGDVLFSGKHVGEETRGSEADLCGDESIGEFGVFQAPFRVRVPQVLPIIDIVEDVYHHPTLPGRTYRPVSPGTIGFLCLPGDNRLPRVNVS